MCYLIINLFKIRHAIVSIQNHLFFKKLKTFDSPKESSFFFASGCSLSNLFFNHIKKYIAAINSIRKNISRNT